MSEYAKELELLAEVLKSALGLSEVHLTEESTAHDFPEWDSLSHVQVILAVEAAFSVRFKPSEIAQFENVGDMVRAIATKKKERIMQALSKTDLESVRRIASQCLQAGAAERDKNQRFPKQELLELGRYGLFGVLVPEEYGGAGLGYHELCTTIEAVAAVDGTAGVILASQNTLANNILWKFGTSEQRKEFLEPLARGIRLCGFALTESHSGSDPFQMRTRARLEGSHYRIQGSKQFVTAATQADWIITFARTSEDRDPKKAFTAFLIPTSHPGYGAPKQEDTLGIRSSNTCQVNLDVSLPEKFRVGEIGQGYEIATRFLGFSRIAMASHCIGLASAAMETALDYACQRTTFGKPIINHQGRLFRMADMATDLAAARLLTRRAASLADAGKSCELESAMAKLFASEKAEAIAREAMQFLGGYGYCRDYPLERIYRDVRLGSLYEGTSDIQRVLIGNSLIQKHLAS